MVARREETLIAPRRNLKGHPLYLIDTSPVMRYIILNYWAAIKLIEVPIWEQKL